VWNIHEGWPTCQYHHMVISAHNVLLDFLNHIASEPHGTVHGILGGTFHNEKEYDKLEDILEPDDVFNIRSHSFRSPKSLWRKGLSSCPDMCPIDMSMDDCKCTCGEDLFEKMEDPDLYTEYIQAALTIKNKDDYSPDILKRAVQIVCEAGTAIGDQLESASPGDVVFWVIHPTVERLYHWKMLKGGFDDVNWPDTGNYAGAVYGSLTRQCHGHGPDDMLPFNLMMDGATKTRRFTNRQMMEVVDPTNELFALPYVYDNFKWDHCAEDGYDFDMLGS